MRVWRDGERLPVQGPQALPAPSQPQRAFVLELQPLLREAQAGPGPAPARLVPAEVISGVRKPLRSAERVTQPDMDGSHPADG